MEWIQLLLEWELKWQVFLDVLVEQGEGIWKQKWVVP